jgi:predicted enzyme related to lactoylglutathione lyase
MLDKGKYPFAYSEPLTAYVSMDVNDMDRAIKFYTEVLGYEVSFLEAKEMGWVEIRSYAEGFVIGLSLVEEKVEKSSTVLMLGIEDCDETKAYLESKGVKTTEIRDIPKLVSLFEFFDTEGNMIQVAGKPRVK